MGVWGTAIFSDDTAADVRESFRDLVGEGLSSEDATRRVLSEYASSLDDPDAGPTVWLALAVTQWKCGRLQEDVKARALDIIESGADLRRWSGKAALLNARRTVLEKTRELLLTPPPEPTRIPKRFRQDNDWDVGELVSYRARSGKYVVFRVLGHHVGKGGKAPQMDLLDYYGDTPPRPERAQALPARPLVERHDHGYALTRQLWVGATSAREVPTDRLTRLGVRVPTAGAGSSAGSRVLLWRPGRPVSIDTFIEHVMPGDVRWRPGPGGEEHARWTIGDILAHRTPDGHYLLFQLVDRYQGDRIDGAPIVALLDWYRQDVPDAAAIIAGSVAPHQAGGFAVAFVLVNDGSDTVPPSALVPIGRSPRDAGHVIRVFASVPMAVRRATQKFQRSPPGDDKTA